MSFQRYFPSVVWLYRTGTGRLARRIYLVTLFLLVCATTVARVRSVLMARKFQAVFAALERVKVDQTTEAELLKIVPYMTRGYSAKRRDGSVETWYSVVISNESDWLVHRLFRFYSGRLHEVADLLGYRSDQVGGRVLLFTNGWFDSCQFVPATPSALSAVRTTVPAPKRPEDEAPLGIM